jgi:hypothetical protein
LSTSATSGEADRVAELEVRQVRRRDAAQLRVASVDAVLHEQEEQDEGTEGQRCDRVADRGLDERVYGGENVGAGSEPDIAVVGRSGAAGRPVRCAGPADVVRTVEP